MLAACSAICFSWQQRPRKKKEKSGVATLTVAAKRWISADERWITGSPLGCQRATPAPLTSMLSTVVVLVPQGWPLPSSVKGCPFTPTKPNCLSGWGVNTRRNPEEGEGYFNHKKEQIKFSQQGEAKRAQNKTQQEVTTTVNRPGPTETRTIGPLGQAGEHS